MKRRDARVLVVDANPAERIATHHALRALGCRLIDEADSGAVALDALLAEHFDLVISAWHLPDMGGRELLWLIRHAPRLADVPVMISTRVTPALVLEAAEAGVNCFLPRPFGSQTLEETLRIFVGRRARPSPRPSTQSWVS